MQKDSPVHLLEVHLEKGMHCVDCHFIQDSHGNSNCTAKCGAAIEIQCTDCHGDIDRKAAWRLGRRPPADADQAGRPRPTAATPTAMAAA